MIPPRPIRRLVLAPLVVVIAVALIVLFPVLAVVTAVFGLVGRLARLSKRGPLRSLRLLWLLTVWLAAETAALFVSLGLWVASGFGGRLRTEPYQARNYAVMRWFLNQVYRSAIYTFGLQVEIEEPAFTPEERLARLARPVIVLSRHAGPGDSVLLVHHLLSMYGRRPRVVMKAALQLDPILDVVANRVPNVFIRHGDTGRHLYTEEIKRLAHGLDRDGALVIFPEGGNWTPGRWRRGIQRLERRGRRDLAARAREMPNLLPPQPGGVLAAIGACPEADVIFVAHAGLDGLVSMGDVWRDMPIGQTVLAQWWRVPFDQVPRSAQHEAQVKWLYDWWQRIDAWITEHRPADAPGLPPGGTEPDTPATAAPSLPDRCTVLARGDDPRSPAPGALGGHFGVADVAVAAAHPLGLVPQSLVDEGGVDGFGPVRARRAGHRRRPPRAGGRRPAAASGRRISSTSGTGSGPRTRRSTAASISMAAVPRRAPRPA
jgi:1-acyl-sn-glycerol-3-phosphate acyltransferase